MVTIGVVLLTRNPCLGTGKTRLSKAVGRSFANKLSLAMLSDALGNLSQVHAEERIVLTQRSCDAHIWLEEASRHGWEVHWYTENSFQQKVEYAFSRTVEKSSYVLVTVCDAPAINAEEINDKLLRIDASKEALLGECFDGGIYALGVPVGADLRFLRDIPWSTSSVASSTKAKLNNYGLAIRELTKIRDLDVYEDVIAARTHDSAVLEERAPRTLKVLDELA